MTNGQQLQDPKKKPRRVSNNNPQKKKPKLKQIRIIKQNPFTLSSQSIPFLSSRSISFTFITINLIPFHHNQSHSLSSQSISFPFITINLIPPSLSSFSSYSYYSFLLFVVVIGAVLLEVLLFCYYL